jgi:uncharacterized protein (DUF488 family)
VNKLYTLGYQQLRGIYSLLNLAVPLDATLVDIRYTPWSRDEQWTERSLFQRLCDLQFGGLKCRYVHIKELGNVNYNQPGQPIEIWLPEVGIARLHERLKEKPCILLCGCRDVERCHRKVVAELAERWIEGLEVEHLAVTRYGQAARASDLVEAVPLMPVIELVKKKQPQGQMSLF